MTDKNAVAFVGFVIAASIVMVWMGSALGDLKRVHEESLSSFDKQVATLSAERDEFKAQLALAATVTRQLKADNEQLALRPIACPPVDKGNPTPRFSRDSQFSGRE